MVIPPFKIPAEKEIDADYPLLKYDPSQSKVDRDKAAKEAADAVKKSVQEKYKKYSFQQQIKVYDAILALWQKQKNEAQSELNEKTAAAREAKSTANKVLKEAQQNLELKKSNKERYEKAVKEAQAKVDTAEATLTKTKSDHEELTAQIEQINEKMKGLEALRMTQVIEELGRNTASFDLSNLHSVHDRYEGNEHLLEISSEKHSNRNILNRLITLLITTIGTFAVLMLVVAAFMMIGSEGDQNRLQKGKNILLYTIIGLVVAFTSYMLVQFVLSILFN